MNSESVLSEAYQDYRLVGGPNYSTLTKVDRYHTRVFRPGTSDNQTGNSSLTFTLTACRSLADDITSNLSEYLNAYYYVYRGNNGTPDTGATTGWMSLQTNFQVGIFSIGSNVESNEYPFGQTAIQGGRAASTTVSDSFTTGMGTIVYTAKGKVTGESRAERIVPGLTSKMMSQRKTLN